MERVEGITHLHRDDMRGFGTRLVAVRHKPCFPDLERRCCGLRKQWITQMSGICDRYDEGTNFPLPTSLGSIQTMEPTGLIQHKNLLCTSMSYWKGYPWVGTVPFT